MLKRWVKLVLEFQALSLGTPRMIECFSEVEMSTDAKELTGRVVNGVVVLDQPGTLEDGTEVRVKRVEQQSQRDAGESSLSEMLLKFAGTIEGLPEDMALNHDHYLYGVPKKRE